MSYRRLKWATAKLGAATEHVPTDPGVTLNAYLLRFAASAILVGTAGCSEPPRTDTPFDATFPTTDAVTEGRPDSRDSAPVDERVPRFDAAPPPPPDAGLLCPTATPLASLPDGSCSTDFQTGLDAGPGGRPVTPDDVACDADSDCMLCVDYDCCYLVVRGENKTSTGTCTIVHKCPPPIPGPGGACKSGTGVVTQDCKINPFGSCVGLACVEHVCITYAP